MCSTVEIFRLSKIRPDGDRKGMDLLGYSKLSLVVTFAYLRPMFVLCPKFISYDGEAK
jgi:hypothetical protein